MARPSRGDAGSVWLPGTGQGSDKQAWTLLSFQKNPDTSDPEIQDPPMLSFQNKREPNCHSQRALLPRAGSAREPWHFLFRETAASTTIEQ